jgi:hypothetical protein
VIASWYVLFELLVYAATECSQYLIFGFVFYTGKILVISYWINPNTNWSLFITGAGDSAEFAATELFALQPV